MILVEQFDLNKNNIDIIYYFNSLQDIVAHLLGCDEKQALTKIEEIYNIDESRKQQKITDFFTFDLTTKKRKNESSDSNSKNKQMKQTKLKFFTTSKVI